MKNHKIVYMGTPDFAVLPLKQLLEEGFDIAAVVTAPDKPAGRGRKLSQSAVKLFASDNNLKVLQPTNLKDPVFIQELKDTDAYIFIVVAFRMLPEAVWSLPRLGTFNLHASLLPQYRGAAPINHAIINGEEKTGVTTFLIDHKIDTGNILYQQECNINKDDNAGSLHDKLMHAGASLVVDTAKALISGKATPKPQDSTNTNPLKPAPKLTSENTKIDWEQTAPQINNFIRGLSPYPAAHTTMENGDNRTVAKIYKVTINDSADTTTLSPGELETDNRKYLRVGCGKGSVYIESLKIAGKKKLSVKEFLAGFREADTYRMS